jgi:predicted SAM-dependent methyltransferase
MGRNTVVPIAPPPAPSPAPPASRRRRETARLLEALRAGADRLNFGCGPHPLPTTPAGGGGIGAGSFEAGSIGGGWINIDNGDGEWYDAPDHPDVIALDLFEALAALPDACASAVYSEHVFEHFTLQQGHEILRGWFRVLKPRGVVRIVCPDLESEARLYLRQIAPAPDHVIDAHRRRWLDGRLPLQQGESLTRAMVLNASMRLDGHKFIYDFETLAQSLRLAGFVSVERRRFGESPHAALNGIDRHDGGDTGRSWVPAVALVVEATRPEGEAPRTPEPPREPPGQPSALDRARAEADALRQRVQALESAQLHLRRRLVELVADRCAASGYRRIALYGAGRHTPPIIREPWATRGIEVVAVLDDQPRQPDIAGVPVLPPGAAPAGLDAVVVSSDVHEQAIVERARATLDPRIPVLRIYGSAD